MKAGFKTEIKEMFETLNARLEDINRERVKEEEFRLPKAEITLLGQMSLLANEKVAAVLSLAQTGDVDALRSGFRQSRNLSIW